MTITTLRGKKGLGDDGAEKIKRHPWFKGTDWDSESWLSTCAIASQEHGTRVEITREGADGRLAQDDSALYPRIGD